MRKRQKSQRALVDCREWYWLWLVSYSALHIQVFHTIYSFSLFLSPLFLSLSPFLSLLPSLLARRWPLCTFHYYYKRLESNTMNNDHVPLLYSTTHTHTHAYQSTTQPLRFQIEVAVRRFRIISSKTPALERNELY